jgi:pilus assembly protein CpaE
MTVIVETDRSRLSILQAMLHGSVPLESMEALSEHIASTPHEFAVVIGPSIPVDEAAVFAQWARVHKTDLGVILLRETVDAHALSAALRSGMREVVEAKDLAGLTTAVSRARRSRPPSCRRWRTRHRRLPRPRSPRPLHGPRRPVQRPRSPRGAS